MYFSYTLFTINQLPLYIHTVPLLFLHPSTINQLPLYLPHSSYTNNQSVTPLCTHSLPIYFPQPISYPFMYPFSSYLFSTTISYPFMHPYTLPTHIPQTISYTFIYPFSSYTLFTIYQLATYVPPILFIHPFHKQSVTPLFTPTLR